MSDGVLAQERLFELTGLRQKAALRRHLRRAGVPFKEIAGKIMTTEEAFTATLVGRGTKRKSRIRWDAID